MAKKIPSSDPEKLRKWLEQHSEDGKLEVGGVLVPIIERGSFEFCAYVHEADYNRALVLSAPLSFDRGDICQAGILAIYRQPMVGALDDIVDLRSLPTYQKDEEISREFRCRITQSCIKALQSFNENLGLNNSQLGTVILKHYNSDPGAIALYEKWMAEWIKKTGLSREKIETTIYDFLRVEGTTKRYNLAKTGDPEAARQKMI